MLKIPSVCVAETMGSPTKPKRQRVDLTGYEKKRICEVHREHPSMSHSKIAQFMVAEHGFKLVDRTTISKILDHSDKWLQVEADEHHGQTKRARHSRFPQVDKALMMWYGQVRARRGIINDAMLSEKAAEFRDAFGISPEDLKLSSGWLWKFKSRYGIASHNLHGESGDVDAHGVGVSHFKLRAVIATYAPEDVFNFDETGLYYRALPSKALNVVQSKGMKKEKDRVTLGLCANLFGKERLKMIFIHKSARPRCFPRAFDSNILVHYYHNSTALMTADVFTSWVMCENTRIGAQGRKILILLDNAASHQVQGMEKTTIGGFEAFVLSNITLLFFPPNVTSVVQPMDQGVIVALKVHYKRKLVAWTLEQCSASQDLGATHANLVQCMVWVVAAWNEVNPETIRNAWRVSNILPRDWNVRIANLEERVKKQMKGEVAELEKLIASLDLGKTTDGNPIQKVSAFEYIDMVDEDYTEPKFSTSQIVELIENGEVPLQVQDSCQEDEEQDDGSMDTNDMERPTIQMIEARIASQKLLDFMVGEGSSSFTCSELLQMERICDKLSKMCLAHVTTTKQSDIESFVLQDSS